MARKKKTRRKKSTSKGKSILKDERLPKIIGVLCWLVAIYLSIAFISYFYTWQEDQDKVLHYSWKMLFQADLQVNNWLGRLGALTSNFFIYWGFGLSSIVFVFLFVRLGYVLIKKKSVVQYLFVVINTFIIASLSALVLEFIFSDSGFAWGGSLGSSSYIWLSNFVGTIGLFFFILFSGFALTIWYFNPKLNTLQLENLDLRNVSFKSFNPIEFFKQKITTKKDKTTSKSEDDDWDVVTEDNKTEAISKIESKESQRENSDEKDQLELDFPEAPSSSNDDDSDDFEISTTPSDSIDAMNPMKDHPFDDLGTNNPKEHSTHIPSDQPYDPHADLSSYEYPSLELLNSYNNLKVQIDHDELKAKKDQIVTTLEHYKIKIEKIRATIGPTVTLYEIIPAPGIKISKIKNLEDDIALSLAALGIRIIAPIPGKGTIGIEVPNKKPQIVALKDILKSEKFQNTKMALPIALGKTISNEVFIADLAKMPHLLIAGATGQGKSVGINTILMSLLYKKHPSELKLVLVDPKRVELPIYNDIENHFLAKLPDSAEPIITDTTKVIHTINSLCIEMDNRYDLLQKARVRNLKEYNKKFKERKLNPKNGHKFLPFIVLVIDEFADLIMTAGKEIELPIGRLAQLARAVGIHLIIATQRPSVKIITGLIKANFPARLAFKVTSLVDSRTILDGKGAEQLIGRGDMLLSVGGTNMIRLQCAFVDTPEVEEVIANIREQQSYNSAYLLPEFKGEDENVAGSGMAWSELDPMFEEAAQLVVVSQSGSTSLIQRKLSLGYNRAGRIMDQLEAFNIVGPPNGSKPREVLYMTEGELMNFLDSVRED